MAPTSSTSDENWERHRHEIARLYITESKSLETTMAEMLTLHGFQASVSSYERRLARWKMNKNLTRPAVHALLETAEASLLRFESLEEGSVHTTQKSSRLKNYLRRVRGPDRRQWLIPSQQIVPAERPSSGIPLSKSVNAQAGFLHCVSRYINIYCERQIWTYPNLELLVESSENQDLEKTALHNFINGIDIGQALMRWQGANSAFPYWRYASRQIDILIQGTYHDILPSLLLKLCELCDAKQITLAEAFMRQIYLFSQRPGHPPSPESEIYRYFGEIAVQDLPYLYEEIMKQYIALFPVHFPPEGYNNNVMRHNLTRRRLKQLYWTTFEQELPNIKLLEETFGRYNRRSLDVLALHADCALSRDMLYEADASAELLINRAGRLANDHWLRLYYLFQGYYTRGCTMHRASCFESAYQNLMACLHILDVFRDLLFGFMFDTQKLDALRRLDDISTVLGYVGDARLFMVQWQGMVSEMHELDLIESHTPS